MFNQLNKKPETSNLFYILPKKYFLNYIPKDISLPIGSKYFNFMFDFIKHLPNLALIELVLE